ncbi:phosphodiester glycosidase family protein [Pleurocapsa sp. PCC 7319]|uniref:phosphodiester glycosidase family protein n=1 Tax=Pleurocapsa sp. PCC 7319 TaxID=118161 RepID=UPI000344A6D6|nr:phosphodiester glycosidase family protein [Pleurocapsa sp. PCC 7319]
MKKAGWILLAFISLSVILFADASKLSSVNSATSNDRVRYEVIERSQHTIHTITIPHHSNYSVIPRLSGELQSLSDFVTLDSDRVVAAINGGYFDPINQKTTSFISQQSQIVADPRFNERLVDNPDLKPYLGKIFNRAEFRRYGCGEKTQYDIQLHSAPVPANCELLDSLGGGPGLLPTDTSVAEAFIAYQNDEKIRDAIGSDSLNARSAIAITGEGDIILAMVAQNPDQPLNSGISLPELADFLSGLGATKAMNLDGGSSASLYYNGQTFYGRVDKEGNQIKRPIKSVLLVKQQR